jgi:hypothetical protein
MSRLLLAALLLLPALSARAGFGADEAGTSAAAFLKLGADARAAAMGGAVRAAVDDATATHWNPAGLAGLRYRHATLTHAASYESTFHDFIAYAQPIESLAARRGRERDLRPDQIGVLGASLLYSNSGSIDETDNTGAATGQRFTPQDFAFTVAWGATMLRGLDAGVGLKYVSSKISGSAQTGAVDAGVRWRTWLPGDFPYALALTVANAGGKLKFRDASDPLPLTVAVGQAVKPVKSLTLTLDLVAPRDRALYPAFGAEWKAPMQQGLAGALRLGYDGRLGRADAEGMSGLTFGGGLSIKRFGLDYAWAPAGFLGHTHKLTFSLRF